MKLINIFLLKKTEALQREKDNENRLVKTIINDSNLAKRDTELIFKLKSNEIHLRSEISRLKREIERNNDTWEKKFEILKQKSEARKFIYNI
jgi:hypothetical protein